MSVLPDFMICERVRRERLIEPFVAEQVRNKGPSSGLSPAGYDCTMAPEYWVAKPGSEVIDVRTLDKERMHEFFDIYEGPDFVVMPGMFLLLFTAEYFRMPRDLIGRCTGKSTLRRLGLLNDLTPLEPGWHGQLVVELNFTFPRPIRIHAGMGICQVVFDRLVAPCQADYVDRGGKYHLQTGVTTAR
jgi:dCTP deaminase